MLTELWRKYKDIIVDSAVMYFNVREASQKKHNFPKRDYSF